MSIHVNKAGDIKALSLVAGFKLTGQRLGSIGILRASHSVTLALVDERFALLAIFEADRTLVEAVLLRPGSKARNELGALAITKFISIGHKLWAADELAAKATLRRALPP